MPSLENDFRLIMLTDRQTYIHTDVSDRPTYARHFAMGIKS